MKKIIKLKEDWVSELSTQIDQSKSFIIFEYSGLTAQEITTLRKKLLESKASLKIVKNNILNRALQKSNIKDFNELVGPNAIALGNEDEIAPLREIFNISKDNDFIKIKGSYLENNFLDVEKTKAIATLPNREGMYSMFLSCLTSPIRSVMYALKAVADQKESAPAA